MHLPIEFFKGDLLFWEGVLIHLHVELQSRRARIQLLLCIGVAFWDSARPRSRGVAAALPPLPHNYELPGDYLSALPRLSRPHSAGI